MIMKAQGKIKGICEILERAEELIRACAENGGFYEEKKLVSPTAVELFMVAHKNLSELVFEIDLYERAFLEPVDEATLRYLSFGEMESIANVEIELNLSEFLEVIKG